MSRIRTKTGGLPYARYQLQRSILETALENDYSSEDREEALEFFGGCAYCGDMPAPRNDHLIPVVQCGDFVRHNVVPACQPCDDSKGQKEYHEWMRNSNSPRSLKHRKKLPQKKLKDEFGVLRHGKQDIKRRQRSSYLVIASADTRKYYERWMPFVRMLENWSTISKLKAKLSRPNAPTPATCECMSDIKRR